MTPEEKIENVRAQLDAICEERTNTFHCPYCGGNTVTGSESLCCLTLAKALDAILDREEFVDQAYLAARIADRVN